MTSHIDVEKIFFHEYQAEQGPSVQERLLGPPPPFSYPEDYDDYSEGGIPYFVDDRDYFANDNEGPEAS